MFKITKTGLAAGAATVALAASGVGVGVVSAGASTNACNNATGNLTGSCGDLVNASGYGLAVQLPAQGKVQAGAQIVSSNSVDTSKATDFYAHQSNGNDNERVLEYAPKANTSGLCITQASRGGLNLERCGGKYTAAQEFYGIGDTQNDTGNSNHGLQWVNAATGGVIKIGANKVTTPSLASSSNTNGTYLHWVQ